MGVQINTIEARHRFVKGAVTTGTPPAGHVACGYGTAFPMEVTLDQVAEVLYRVRLAQFTQGSVTDSTPIAYGSAALTIEVVNATSIPDKNTPFQKTGDVRCMRGYGYGWNEDGYGSDTDLTPYGQGFYKSVNTDGTWRWRAIKDNERGIYFNTGGSLGTGGSGSYLMSFNDALLQTGFGFELSVSGPDFGSINAIRVLNPGQAHVRISRDVAWVGDVSPFDSSSRLYLGVEFFTLLFPFFGLFTNKSVYGGVGTDTEIRFRLVLAGGVELSCPIYSERTGLESKTDFIMRAIEWWPYAKSDGSPAWNSTTGVAATGGPGV